MRALEQDEAARCNKGQVALELLVNNHPGVMSHVCGLFSRRAFNLEGIFCLPLPGGKRSRIWLLVAAGGRLDQIMKQAGKLEDVLDVRESGDGRKVFEHMGSWLAHGSQ